MFKKRIAWLTDIHLNFVDAKPMEEFFERVRRAAPDAILISGDIAESLDIVKRLTRIDDELDLPVYFVLGNHDFYFGSIAGVRNKVDALCGERPRLVYLTHSDPIELAPGVGLIGHDGWADGREGDYERSYVMMNDYRLIEELAGVNRRERLALLHALGDKAAAVIRERLTAAASRFPRVLLVTHVPPLREACWYDGRISNDEWAPHFVCQAMGQAILDVMRSQPACHLTVFCGHTHGIGECRPLDNVVIYTGSAEYGKPDISQMFDL